MPFPRPGLDDLRGQLLALFESRLNDGAPLPRVSNLRVIADVVAAQMHAQYGFLDRLALMALPDTATGVWLERWTVIFGIERRPAAFAAGPVAVAGSDGAAVPAGAVLRSPAATYRVTAGATVAAGTATVQAEALQPGAAGNADPGAPLTFATALPGIAGQASVAGDGLAGGADAEPDADLRARLLARIRQPPHGGAAFDYVAWALQVPGVTRVWPSGLELGAGTVVVRFMMDTVRGDQAGIPTAADIDLVAAHLAPLRPVTAEVTVLAPVAVPLDLTIADLDPDTPEVRAAIAAELADLLRRRAAPGATIWRSNLWEAVSIATGEDRHRLVAPAADVTHAAGEIAVPGTVTYA